MTIIKNFLRLSERIATAGQPTESQLSEAAGDSCDAVLNLGLLDPKYCLPDEAGLAKSRGLEYRHIPVRFDAPSIEDFQIFAAVMDAWSDKRVLVHCAANYRVSGFMALYGEMRLGWSRGEADRVIRQVWEPNATWLAFLQAVRAAVIDPHPAVHRTTTKLEAGLDWIRQSPKDSGPLRLIVRRPRVDAREVLLEGTLDASLGLEGDTWNTRSSSRTPDRSPHPDMQLNIINARAIAAVAGDSTRWPLAGDQLFLDLDLSADNLPTGTQLALGSAVIEVTAQPHTGCHKFKARFGEDGVRFVNSSAGKMLRLRGINAKVVQRGTIRVGDLARKI